jgi:hypothetical protein
LGDSGTRGNVEPESDPSALVVGMCRDSPRVCTGGREGVVGTMAVSSLETCRSGSRKAGDGERTGFWTSESERGLGEPELVVLDDRGVRSPSLSSCWVSVDLVGDKPSPTGGACSMVDMLRLRPWAVFIHR